MKGLNFRFEKKRTEDEPRPISVEEPEIDTAGQTETFWTRNVRLLTFLICMAVFLAVFGPYSVFRIRACMVENRLEGDPMTVEDVIDLAALHDQLKFSDFQRFERSESKGEDTLYYAVRVEEKYLVMVGASERRGPLTYFTVSRIDNDRTVDVMGVNYQPTELYDLLGVK